MTITYGSRNVHLNEPFPYELKEIAGLEQLPTETQILLLRAYRAGAEACLVAIEGSRGARLENLLLEEPHKENQ